MRFLERNDTRIADRRKDAVGMENGEEDGSSRRGEGKEEARNNRRRRRRRRRDSFEEETLVGFARGEAFRQLELTSTTFHVLEEKCLCSWRTFIYTKCIGHFLCSSVNNTTRNNTEKKIWRKTGRKKKKKKPRAISRFSRSRHVVATLFFDPLEFTARDKQKLRLRMGDRFVRSSLFLFFFFFFFRV